MRRSRPRSRSSRWRGTAISSGSGRLAISASRCI
ncbi:hypothetical protein CORC01_06892 [Colletotrichum orchidophilum]|uniref:Uncharacterized protein n=1 Tax=Colletotrichum orchidophilum TaxID=1209926 RepID=A0A1G4B8W0_9PEZI|nr:uncharacterized protein CORC01_06892 [Colletotrichum orchidophilum]OHE97857.1 hypothetical protein CORC01_06892 [Colletotrichum orchidophilum]